MGYKKKSQLSTEVGRVLINKDHDNQTEDIRELFSSRPHRDELTGNYYNKTEVDEKLNQKLDKEIYNRDKQGFATTEQLNQKADKDDVNKLLEQTGIIVKSAVKSINGKTGDVVLNYRDVNSVHAFTININFPTRVFLLLLKTRINNANVSHARLELIHPVNGNVTNQFVDMVDFSTTGIASVYRSGGNITLYPDNDNSPRYGYKAGTDVELWVELPAGCKEFTLIRHDLNETVMPSLVNVLEPRYQTTNPGISYLNTSVSMTNNNLDSYTIQEKLGRGFSENIINIAGDNAHYIANEHLTRIGMGKCRGTPLDDNNFGYGTIRNFMPANPDMRLPAGNYLATNTTENRPIDDHFFFVTVKPMTHIGGDVGDWNTWNTVLVYDCTSFNWNVENRDEVPQHWLGYLQAYNNGNPYPQYRIIWKLVNPVTSQAHAPNWILEEAHDFADWHCNWWRKWENGMVEQGGISDEVQGNSWKNIPLHIPVVSNYTVQLQEIDCGAPNETATNVSGRHSTYFQCCCKRYKNRGGWNAARVVWTVRGRWRW